VFGISASWIDDMEIPNGAQFRLFFGEKFRDCCHIEPRLRHFLNQVRFKKGKIEI